MHTRIGINSINGDIIYISLTKIDKSFQAISHSHPNGEILYIIEGKGCIQTTSHNIPLSSGNIVLINSNATHMEVSSESLKFYAIGLNKTSFFLKNNLSKRVIKFDLSYEEISFVKNLFSNIYQEAIEKKSEYLELISYLVKSLFIFINRKNCRIYDSITSSNSDLVTNIKNFVDLNYANPIDLKEIAKRFSLSTSSICHKFKEETNVSIIEYKIQKQLEEANNLLRVSDMTVLEIALQVGFNNTSYFNKQYKHYYGITPLKNRKLMQKK
ncbi:MAG: AraC family transcriptional regulator [Bacillales bacterium]|nr:AraC family transcriptional regulator [Bacillales bacterium]